jgi:hypothetical protein
MTTFVTYAGLTTTTSIVDADLLASFSGTGPLKSIAASYIKAYVLSGLTGTSGHAVGYLDGANTWSGLQTFSLGTSTTALDYIALKPTDYGTNKPGLFISKDATALNWTLRLYDGTTAAGQLNVGCTLINLTGAFTASGTLTGATVAATGNATVGGTLIVTGAATFSAGVTQTGGTRQNVTAVPVLDLVLSSADLFTKSISTNSTFTFSGLPTSGGGFALLLTISSAAVPTWPASVKWDHGTNPSATLGNGTHTLGFLTFDGGTTWSGFVGSIARA